MGPTYTFGGQPVSPANATPSEGGWIFDATYSINLPICPDAPREGNLNFVASAPNSGLTEGYGFTLTITFDWTYECSLCCGPLLEPFDVSYEFNYTATPPAAPKAK